MALRLVNIDSGPDVEHLKLPRALASGTTTNKVGVASTINVLAQVVCMGRALIFEVSYTNCNLGEAVADTTETREVRLQPSYLSSRLTITAPTFRLNLPGRSFWNQRFVLVRASAAAKLSGMLYTHGG